MTGFLYIVIETIEKHLNAQWDANIFSHHLAR